jgi:two-component system sensor histidine kinase KdpD
MTEHDIKELWPATERVLVGFDSRPHTRQVLRDAWRLSHGLHADLIAVYIQAQGYHAWTGKIVNLLRYGSNTQKQREEGLRRLEEHALFAEDLGAEVIRAQSDDIARKLIEIDKERQITQIVLGQPARSRWEEIVRGSTINRLLRLNSGIDIHLVPLGGDDAGA